jgi:hypothetical protein
LSSLLLFKNVEIRKHKIIIFSVVLYGCETWSPTLREEHRLRPLENRVLRRIFGRTEVEIVGGWIKLHNEELHNLYCSSNVIRMIKSRKMRWAGHVPRMGKNKYAYSVLVGNPEGKKPLGRRRHRWKDDTVTCPGFRD